MLIVYCEKCGVRVNEKELAAGAAIAVDDNTHYCPKCAVEHNIVKPKGKAPVPRGTAIRSSEQRPTAAMRAATRAANDEASAQNAKGSKTALIGLAAAGVLLVVGGIFVFSGNSKPAETRKPQQAETQPAQSQPQPPTPTPATVDVSKPPRDDDRPRPGTAATAKDDPELEKLRVANAMRRLDEAKVRFKANSADPWVYQDNLRALAATYRGTPAATEADRILSELKLPENRPAKYWVRDWRITNAFENAVIEHAGRPNVLRVQALDQDTPAQLYRKLTVPLDKPFMCFTAAPHPEGDFELSVAVDGKELFAEPFRGNEWRQLAFDLSALRGKEAEISLYANPVNGWSLEYLYLEAPRFELAAPANARVISSSAPALAPNLLKNADFESGSLAEWTVSGKAELVADAQAGKAGVRMPGKSVIEQNIPLQKLTRYKFTAYGKAPPDGGLVVGIRQGDREVKRNITVSDRWGRCSIVFLSTSEEKTRFYLSADSKSAAFVDSVTLTQLSPEVTQAFNNNPKLPVAPEADWTRAIELLPLVEVSADVVAGKWQRDPDGALVSTSHGRIQVPYAPPAEYDVKLTFTPDAKGEIHFIAWAKDRHFLCLFGGFSNTIFGYEAIHGIAGDVNSCAVSRPGWLTKGQKHTVIVQVRTDGVRTLFDGTLINAHKTDYADLLIVDHHKLRDKNVLGLMHLGSGSAIFHSLQIAEVTGQGKATRKPAAGPAVEKPPPPPPPPIAGVAASKAEYERLCAEMYVLLRKGQPGAAAEKVAAAQKQPALAGFAKQLALDAQIVKFSEDLQAAIPAGLIALTNGQAFTFKMKAGGKDLAVGKGTPNAVKEIKDRQLSVETDLGGGKAIKKYSLHEFTAETHAALMRLGLAQMPDNDVKLLVIELMNLYSDSCSVTLKQARQHLDTAAKGKVPAELLEHVKSRLDMFEKELAAPARLEKIDVLINEKKYKEAQEALNALVTELAGTRALDKLQARTNAKAAQLDKLLNPLKPGLVGFYFKHNETKGETKVELSANLGWGENAPAPNAPKDEFSSRIRGFLRIDADGAYEFTLVADDAGELLINGASILKCGNNEPEKPATANLKKGENVIQINHREGNGGARVIVKWKPPGAAAFTDIPPEALWHDPDKMAEYQKP